MNGKIGMKEKKRPLGEGVFECGRKSEEGKEEEGELENVVEFV